MHLRQILPLAILARLSHDALTHHLVFEIVRAAPVAVARIAPTNGS